MSRAIDGVIFDLDGVLVDSEVIAFRALQNLLAPEILTWEEYATLIGTSEAHTNEWLRTRYRRPESAEDLRRLTSEHLYRALDETVLEPMPGATALVEAIVGQHLRLGVASQSSPRWVERVLTAIGLRPHVEAITTASEVAQAKPAPDVYLAAAARLALNPARAIAIEDSVPGIESASAAGLQVIQLRAAHDAPPPHPAAHAVVASLQDFDLGWLSRGVR